MTEPFPIREAIPYIERRLGGPADHVEIGKPQYGYPDELTPAQALGLLIGLALSSWAVLIGIGIALLFMARLVF